MKLGDLGCRLLDAGHFIYDIEEVAEKEVNLSIRSIGSPCDGSGSRIWDDFVQSCHRGELTRHHSFPDVILGYLPIAQLCQF